MKELHTTLLIVRKENKILLARKKRGFGFGKWNGIGGKVEKTETIEEAMIREIQEEISVTPIKYEKIGIIRFVEYIKEELTTNDMHLYIATKWQGTPKESEEMQPQWFSIEHLPWNEMFDDDKYWLPLVLEGKKLNAFFQYDKNWNLLKYKVEEQKDKQEKETMV